MKKKKYLIYVDILGFESKAREMAAKTGVSEDLVRENLFTAPLEKKLKEIDNKKMLSEGYSVIEGTDDYVLVVDEIQTAFEVVGELLKLKHIPFEIGVGRQEFDDDIDMNPKNRKETIAFLKDDIINPYRRYYKNKHCNSIKETFLLFTEKVFDDLEPLDKIYCEKICYEKTFFVVNVKKIQQRCKVFDFLRKIGYPGSRWYGRIDEVYVPPVEYDDIEETLKNKRIVFITGTQEYGKTYTAIRLMWEFYNKGYTPKWIKGGEEKERVTVRERL